MRLSFDSRSAEISVDNEGQIHGIVFISKLIGVVYSIITAMTKMIIIIIKFFCHLSI